MVRIPGVLLSCNLWSIYLTGTADSNKVDFTNPENFYHDVNSVAGLLKQFFRELPDPLLTSQYYSDFVNAARKLKSSRKYDIRLSF